MKSIQKDIFDFQDRDFFSPIRDKLTYVRLLVVSARQLLTDIDNESTPVIGSVRLIIDKMSRLIFSKGNKYFSIAFPLTVGLEDGKVSKLTTYTGKDLDHRAISAILAILESEEYKANPSLLDLSIEPGGIELSGISLLEEMFLFEPAYLRYDCDPAREDGKLHPLHHIDVNYSQYGRYKLGLTDLIDVEYFINIQNIKTDCNYLVD